MCYFKKVRHFSAVVNRFELPKGLYKFPLIIIKPDVLFRDNKMPAIMMPIASARGRIRSESRVVTPGYLFLFLAQYCTSCPYVLNIIFILFPARCFKMYRSALNPMLWLFPRWFCFYFPFSPISFVSGRRCRYSAMQMHTFFRKILKARVPRERTGSHFTEKF